MTVAIKPFIEKIFPENTIHIPNITDVLGTVSIAGIPQYKNRIIPIMPGNNKIVLPYEQVGITNQLIDYYREYFGSQLTNKCIIPIHCKKNQTLTQAILENEDFILTLKTLPGNKIAEFYTSKNLQKISEKTAKKTMMDFSTSLILNNKIAARHLIKKQKIRTPDGNVILNDDEVFEKIICAVYRLQNLGYREFSLTRMYSCSGQGILRFKKIQELDVLIQQLRPNENFLVEGWLNHVIASPSCQIFLDKALDKCKIIAYTDQILTNGIIHRGNVKLNRFFDSREFSNTVNQLVQYFHHLGARGILGVDLLVSLDPISNQIKTYVVEVNARQTGAIYGALFAEQLHMNNNNKQWMICNDIQVPENCSLDSYIAFLQKSQLHYTHQRKAGVIVMSNGNFTNGKAMIMCIADNKNELFDMADYANFTCAMPNISTCA